jgi:vesicle transport protein SEC22
MHKSQSRLSIDTDNYVFHYTIDQGVCYLVLTDKGYPKRLAFLFLEDLSQEFCKFVKKENGEDWLQAIETAGRQYAFIRFDREIQKKRGEYSDPSSNKNRQKINDDLHSIQTVMRKTIDDVLDRGHKLDDIQAKSRDLTEDSKKYKWGAKKLNTMVSSHYITSDMYLDLEFITILLQFLL